MNKTEILAAVTEHVVEVQGTQVSKALVEKVLNAFYTVIPATLAENKEEEDYKVEVMGFGKWTASFVAGRKGVNPKDRSEEVEIPDGFRVHFSAGQNFKDVVNGKTGTAKKAPSKKAKAKTKAKVEAKKAPAKKTATTTKKKKKK
jgi:nucleoid DNA-binding protein